MIKYKRRKTTNHQTACKTSTMMGPRIGRDGANKTHPIKRIMIVTRKRKTLVLIRR